MSVALLSGVPASAESGGRAPAGVLSLEVSPTRLAAHSEPLWPDPELTLSGSLESPDGVPMPGEKVVLAVSGATGSVRRDTVTTDTKGAFQISWTEVFRSYLTASATWQAADGTELVAKKRIPVDFLDLKMLYDQYGGLRVSMGYFLEQGPDINEFLLQRSFDGVRWTDYKTNRDKDGMSMTWELPAPRSAYWRLVSIDDGQTSPVASKVFDLRRWSTYFAQPKISLRRAAYGKTVKVSGKMGAWSSLTKKGPAAGRSVWLLMDCAGPRKIYRVAKTRTDKAGRYSFKTKAFCTGDYYVSYGTAEGSVQASPAYRSGEFASYSLPVRLAATAVPANAKPLGKLMKLWTKMPSRSVIRSYGRFPDTYGAR
ncbi:carboxypeptidase-like regulatory domain-containing protein [Actinocorallia aurea]